MQWFEQLAQKIKKKKDFKNRKQFLTKNILCGKRTYEFKL